MSSDATIGRFEEALVDRRSVRYDLTLFVSGASDLSTRAIDNATQLCDDHLAGRYDLVVVDLHDHLPEAANSRVVAAPTLVKNLPLPVRKFVGDLSRTDRVLQALDITTSDGPHGGRE